MAIVTHREDGDLVSLRWGEDGTEFQADSHDQPALRQAYRKAVAQGLARGDLITDEVDRSVAREVQEGVGIRKDSNGGLILAWWPSPEEAQALASLLPAGTPGAFAPEDIHLTLLYLAESGWEEGDPREGKWDLQLLGAVVKLFTRRWGPCECKLGGMGRFVGPEDTDAVVLLVDCPDLQNLRRCLEDDLFCYGVVPSSSALLDYRRHGWIPHITLAYVPRSTSTPLALDESRSFEVDNITAAAGPMRERFELMDYGYSDEEDAVPLVRAIDSVNIAKAGRVLSGKNLQSLKDSVSVMQSVIDQEEKRRKEDGYEEEAKKRREFLEAVAGPGQDLGGLAYLVTKASSEKRFTYGPLYAPDRKDAHGEYVEADVLQAAVWEYVRQSSENGRRINLQHGDLGEITVGEWVEVTSWPYEHVIVLKGKDGEVREVEMPANTVYLGAVWDEDAWPLVKAGKIGGWSLGGKAVRVQEGVKLSSLDDMGGKKASRDDPTLTLLRAAADAESALRDRELDAARKDSNRWESAVVRMIDAVKEFSHRHEPDVHVHLPDHSVTIHEDSGLTKLLDSDDQ